MKTWSEIVHTQPLAGQILMNSIQRERISHAYLISGDRGTGKRAIATQLAKSILCEQKDGIDPCQNCTICNRITSKNHPDVHWVEPDGQSIRIEQVKDLQKEFTYSGLESNRKIYIITNADTFTLNAANRILKFLEEPSQKTTAIMLTENSQSIIPTVRSRCQLIDLQPLNPERLQEKLLQSGVSEANATFIRALTNNLAEAHALLEDEWFAQARKLMLQLIDIYSSRPADAYLFIHQHWLTHFKKRDEQERGLDLLLLAFKDILYFHIGNKKSLVVFTSDDDRLKRAMMVFSQEKLVQILHALLKAKRKLKQNVHPTLVMEQLTLHIQR